MKHALSFIVILLALAFNASARDFVLVIDPGHGGKDPGAMSGKLKEKDINLNVALVFGRLVERNCKDVKVIYTRSTDKFVTLDDRAQIPNKARADLFISIHTNAMPKGHSAMRGAETYTLGMHRADDNLEVAKRENSAILIESDYRTRYSNFDPNSSESYIIFEFMQNRNMKQSVDFARDMQAEFRKAGRPDKGVHQAGFLVLRATTMPAALIELGYISNAGEAQFLASAEGPDKMGRAIYNAFLSYKRKNHSSQTSPAPAQTEPVATTTTTTPADTPKTDVPEEPADVTQPADTLSGEITFRVQFMVGHNLVKKIKDIDSFEYYQEGDVYKYTTGRFKTFAEAQHRRNQVAKAYSGAFVVAFRGDTRIDINEARRLTP